MDTKGRLTFPARIRRKFERMGVKSLILKETSEGVLILPGKNVGFLTEFKKTLTSPPARTGKPENWSPSKMKKIWEGAL